MVLTPRISLGTLLVIASIFSIPNIVNSLKSDRTLVKRVVTDKSNSPLEDDLSYHNDELFKENKLKKTETSTDNNRNEYVNNKNIDRQNKLDNFEKESNQSKNNITNETERLREENGRSIDLDITKYTSPNFHNNDFTFAASPDVEKYLNDEDDEEDHNLEEHILTHEPDTFKSSGKLLTPATPLFDKRFKETVDSIEKQIEYLDYSHENLGDGALSGNKTKINYREFKNIDTKSKKSKNKVHRDIIIEKGTKVNYVSTYNDTHVEGDNVVGKEYDQSSEKEESKTAVLNEVKEENYNKIKGDTSERLGKTTPKIVPTTTRKFPSTSSDKYAQNITTLSNNIETDAVTTGKPKRGSVKFVDTVTPTSPTSSEIINKAQPKSHLVNREQTVQENQIIPVQVSPSDSPDTTTAFVTHSSINEDEEHVMVITSISSSQDEHSLPKRSDQSQDITTKKMTSSSRENNVFTPKEVETTTPKIIKEASEVTTKRTVLVSTTLDPPTLTPTVTAPTTLVPSVKVDSTVLPVTTLAPTTLNPSDTDSATLAPSTFAPTMEFTTLSSTLINMIEETKTDLTKVGLTSEKTKDSTEKTITVPEETTKFLTTIRNEIFTTEHETTPTLTKDSNIDGKEGGSITTTTEKIMTTVGKETPIEWDTTTDARETTTLKKEITTTKKETTTIKEETTIPIEKKTKSIDDKETTATVLEETTARVTRLAPLTKTFGTTLFDDETTAKVTRLTTSSSQRTSKSLNIATQPTNAFAITTEQTQSDQTLPELTTTLTTTTVESTTLTTPPTEDLPSTTFLPVKPKHQDPNKSETTAIPYETTISVQTSISMKTDPPKVSTTGMDFVHIKGLDNRTTLVPDAFSPNQEYSTSSPVAKFAQNATATTEENFTTSPTLEPDELNNPEENNGTVIAIVISTVGGICLVILAGLLFIMRKRQKKFNYPQRCRPVSLDDYSMDNVSVYNSVRRKGAMRSSKRSYGNPAFDDPTCVSHPLTFPAISRFANNEEDIKAEFEEIPQITARTNELPEGCDTKNRYANVIPLPETRVFLTAIDGYPCSDYINANYVTGPKNIRGYYIATQAPLSNTVDDFWRMVWEQQSKVILMLTHLFENGIEKCVDYLPPSEVLDCHRLFGDFQVTLKKREVKQKYIISSLQLKNMVSNSWRDVTHLWYLGWPEKGAPSEANSLIAFLIEARSYMKSSTIDKKQARNGDISNGNIPEANPVVVHCSPGTGRTGTVIACDIAIRDFEQTRQVDIPKIVYRIRRDRASSVQTKEQYAFIYKVINLYAAKLTGGALDSM